VSRIAVLGSSGASAHLATILAEDPRVTEIVRGDASDAARAVLSSDVVVGPRAPDPDTERAAALAAIAAGVPYLSTAASPEVYEALIGLHGQAVEAGSLILTGMSWSPGLSNLMAMAAAMQMDATRRIRIAWAASSAGQTAQAALARGAGALTGQAFVFEGGILKEEPAGSRKEKVFMPEPVGWVPLRLARASEPLTLSRAIDGLEEITVMGGLVEPLANQLATRAGGSAIAGNVSEGVATLVAKFKPPRPWSALRVDVTGKKDGKMRMISHGIVDQLSNLLISPVVVAALTLAEMPVRKSGVLAPEDVFDPANFFARLAHQGVRLAVLERAA
jgi:hypothetical protein